MSPVSQAEMLPQLAKYQIIEELGHGGMATVYRARDLRLQRDVAVKIIHKHLRESVEVGKRFEAEARAVAKLRHPNIIEVYDVSAEDESEKYIVVELSRGMTLRRVLAEHHEMPAEVAAALGVELGSALAHAHAAGVIHRDLKPENVLIETDGDIRVKLTDFGIAKILDAQGVTSTGQVLGSPAHMAPEQIEGGEVDARADVFGLGVLLYECMVGHLPFEGKNPAQVLRRVLEGSYAAADRERPAVGGRWSKILARSLAKDAADRFPSADAMTSALRDELTGVGVADPPAELRAFFADPVAYRAQHATKLVAVLTQRGEQARKAGDPHGAAADFNRALAYAPQDPALLKLIGRLRRGRATRRAMMMALAIAAGASLLGVAAFAISRQYRAGLSPSPTNAPRAALSIAPPPQAASQESAAVVAPSAHPIGRPAGSERAAARHPVEPEPPAERNVSFVVVPPGALVRIDDGKPEELFQRTKTLPIGPHSFRAEAPAKSNCCEPLERQEDIKPDDGTGKAQQVRLSLKFKDAIVAVAPGVPVGTQLKCEGVDGPASGTFPLKMSTLEQRISCTLDGPGVSTKATSITLRAGERTTVPWSDDH
jgi:tRNA A-37 threonylcarbamoyl transferase component Bud32